jgi:lipopolysaccharide export system permease protein
VLGIIDRALLKEIFLSFSAILSILLLIIVGQLFVKLLNKTVEGNLPLDTLMPLLALVVLRAVIQLMPVALLLGVMLALGRLYRDSEISAMRACGIGFAQLYRPLIVMAVPLSILLAGLSLYVIPITVRMADQMEYEAKHKTDISGISPGEFIESKQGNWVVFTETADAKNGILRNIFVHGLIGDRVMIETAALAKHDMDPDSGRELLELQNGYRYEIASPKSDDQLMSFDKHTMQIPDLEISGLVNTRDALSSRELWASGKAADQAELQRRISVSISALLLVLLALPMSYTTPRKGRFGKLVVGIVVYLIYYNFINLSINLMETKMLPTWVGVWWVHLLLALLILVLFLKQNGIRWKTSWMWFRTPKA